jgi:ABC-type multidrug transport system permease subunit
MLEVIGAGTSGSKDSITDFHSFYKQSALCQAMESKVRALSEGPAEEGGGNSPTPPTKAHSYLSISALTALSKDPSEFKYNASYGTQFYWLMKRAILTYWRSPSYNFVRMLISLIIALIFASAYVNQQYSTDVETMSRCAVIYITCLFVGIVGMMTVQSVIFAERPAFYREQFSEVYDVGLYSLAMALVELPYLLVSSVIFVIPFFFIVGFDQDGVAEKFFFYWLFQGLYLCTMVFIGQFYCALLPSEAISQGTPIPLLLSFAHLTLPFPPSTVISGMTSTFFTLFGGFMIPSQSIPTFWLFVYWTNPLHYALEGLFTTQFNGDNTKITLYNGFTMTAEEFVGTVFEEWSYKHRGGDIAALLIFIVFLRSPLVQTFPWLTHSFLFAVSDLRPFSPSNIFVMTSDRPRIVF